MWLFISANILCIPLHNSGLMCRLPCHACQVHLANFQFNSGSGCGIFCITAKYPNTFQQASKLWWLKYKPHIGTNCLACHRRLSLHSGIVLSRWVACGFFWHGGCMDGCLFPAKHGAAIGSMAPLSRMFSVTLLPNERVN